MSGNSFGYTGTAQEKLLEEVLNACMEEQLSFIPPEREIARMHTFSQEFQEYMKNLLRTKGKPERKTLTKHEFVYRFNKMAAAILVLLLVGGMSIGAYLILGPKASSEKAEAPAAAPTESASDMMGTIEESAVEEAPAAEEAPAEEPMEEESVSEGAGTFPEEIAFMGSQIQLASIQELPEKTEYVRTLVSSPIVNREAENIKITIGNMNEHPIYYYEVMDLEVWIDGAWYLVPSRQVLTEEEQNYMEVLEPGLAQDEELILEYYELDYEAEKYRVVTYLDGLILSSEFRFEDLKEEADVWERMEE